MHVGLAKISYGSKRIINPLKEFQTLVYNYCLFQNFEYRVLNYT